MCGIIGRISSSASHESVGRALDSISHRGPDSKGSLSFFSFGKKIEIGHTRLSILDLSSSGDQPMESRDRRWVISYNGEIYNHENLRKDLKGTLKGHSDTETLIETIASIGICQTLPRLNGMFGFALFDRQTGKLYLVRDPFGIKPVYYCHQNGSFCFSSEIRGIRAVSPGSLSGIDQNAVQTFLTLRYTPSPDTLVKNIKRLKPGHILCYDVHNDTFRITRYVKFSQKRFQGSIDDAIRAYTIALKNAVFSQLVSDVPVGILLSGGIDSSLIAGIASEVNPKLPCFTVGFGRDYKDCEIQDAAETASVLGLRHEFVEVDSDDLWSALQDVIQSVEEPLGTTSILPMWFLVQRAREDVAVVLTGQGNDEPWGGYLRYQAEIWRKIFPFPVFYQAVLELPGLRKKLPEFAERAIRSLGERRLSDRFLKAYTLFTPDERRLLSGVSDEGNSLTRIQYWLDCIECRLEHPVEHMMRIDTRMNLSDDLLLYGDKTSMAFSLEARVPMLDLDLIELVDSFPVSFKLDYRKTKIVHRRAAEAYLPSRIINRPKKGFQVPFADWARGRWRDRIEAVLFDSTAPYLSVLDKKGVQRIWREHLIGKRDRTRQLFALLSFAHFMAGPLRRDTGIN